MALLRSVLQIPLVLILWLGLNAARAERAPLAEPRFITASGSGAIVDGIVAALAQDDRGLIWVGTSVGVMRFDGYRTKSYPMPTPEGGRAGRFVRGLLADREGRLWVASDAEGLALLDTITEQWREFRHDSTLPASISPGRVTRLERAADGRIWVGLLRGLDRLDPASGRFEHFRANDGSGLLDDHVTALLVDRAGTLWVGTRGGVVRRRADGQSFQAVGELAPQDTVTAMAQGPDGSIWAGLRSGRLMRIDPADGEIHALSVHEGEQSSAVLSLRWVDDELWVGRVAGLEIRRADGSILKTLSRKPRKTWMLSGTDFHALLKDRAGTVWVGSYGGGLQRHDPGNQALWVRRQDDDPNSPLAETDVRSVLQLRNGEVWLGTLERGIAVVDRELRTLAAIRPQGQFNGLVAALAQTRDGDIWAGTDTGRLYRFDVRRRLLETLVIEPARVRRLLDGLDGGLWIGTSDGLYQLSPGTHQVHQVHQVPLVGSTRWTGNVNAIAQAKDGQLWAGGDSGLYRLVDGALQAIDRARGLPRTTVLGLLLDAHGRLWVDTSAGLFRDTPDGRFEAVGSRDRFGERGFGANMLEDSQGRIWTHRGVLDPGAGSFTEISKVDGADIGTGWFRAYSKLDDGRFLFGGSTGLLVVEPSRFRRWSFLPPVVATELSVNGKPLPAGMLMEEFTLTPRQRAFSLEFAALDYSAPAQNRYRYRLNGYDEGWISATAEQRVASYANLAPGRYSLEIQGSNRLGDWSDQTLRVGVEIQPAWWQTWWARGLAALLAGLGVYGVVKWRTAALERRVRERTAELEALSEVLMESSLSDPLTGLRNRRYLMQHVDSDVAAALRRHAQGGQPPDNGDLIFMLIDVDHFKQVNDRHGHSAGDAVLMQIGERLREVCRDSDHIVRWGGEEFLVVAREASRERAADLAERLRRAIVDRPFLIPDGQSLTRSCSIGFACYPLLTASPKAMTWSDTVDAADGALYEAKRSGRNRWVGVVAVDAEMEPDMLRKLLTQPSAEWLTHANLRVLRSSNAVEGVVEVQA